MAEVAYERNNGTYPFMESRGEGRKRVSRDVYLAYVTVYMIMCISASTISAIGHNVCTVVPDGRALVHDAVGSINCPRHPSKPTLWNTMT